MVPEPRSRVRMEAVKGNISGGDGRMQPVIDVEAEEVTGNAMPSAAFLSGFEMCE